MIPSGGKTKAANRVPRSPRLEKRPINRVPHLPHHAWQLSCSGSTEHGTTAAPTSPAFGLVSSPLMTCMRSSATPRPDGGHRSKNAPVLSAQKIYIDEVIAAGASNLAFVKIDTDSVDDQLMQRFIQLMQAGSVTVSTFTVEEPGAETCWTMHTLGYSLYIPVNVHTNFSPSPAWGAGVVSTRTEICLPSCEGFFPSERCLLGLAGYGDQEGNR